MEQIRRKTEKETGVPTTKRNSLCLPAGKKNEIVLEKQVEFVDVRLEFVGKSKR